MAFEALGKTSEVTPLLVRLYDTHNLYTLAGEKDNSSAHLELTTIMLDLLKIKLNDREQELITDVILSLMKQAEKDLRVALSERIAIMDDVPLRMILGFTNDEIDVAKPVLKFSTVLQDLDLAYIFQSKGVEYGRAIATRSSLSVDMIDMLIDSKDFEIAVNLCKNDGLKLTQHAFKICAEISKENAALNAPLISRHDLPKEIAVQLYHIVGEELKNTIKKKFGLKALTQTENVIDGIVAEMSGDSSSAEVMGVMNHLLEHAKGLDLVGELKPSLMIANLRRGQNASFVAQFSVFSKLSLMQAKRIFLDNTGLSLAKVCRAMEVSKGDFVSIYLLSQKIRGDAKKSLDHKELSRVMSMYDGINGAIAKDFLKKLRH